MKVSCLEHDNLEVEESSIRYEKMRVTNEIPEEYRDHPERYFDMLNKQETFNEIKHLENRVEELREKNEGYKMALYEIASIIRIWKPRGRRTNYKRQITEISKILSKFPEEIKEIDLDEINKRCDNIQSRLKSLKETSKGVIK